MVASNLMKQTETESNSDPREAFQEVPPWKCGDPFVYSVPKPDGDHWGKLLQPLLAKDKQQCDAWKDEVENLLIFAGLFSAVITAFVIETYKGLQPDPHATVTALLSQIATSLEDSRNGISAAGASTECQLPTPHSPSSAVYAVNTFWFISLVLSLTTVLMGTVGLQWLREHQRYPIQITNRDKFALFNMRRQGLEDWCVPKIFSALPMLLQLSLLLFLAGLIVFLVSLAPAKVYAPIILIIGVPIIFIILTTITPSYQWLIPPAFLFRICKRVPSQCPYKSPQSTAFTAICASTLHFIYNRLSPFSSVLRNRAQDIRRLLGGTGTFHYGPLANFLPADRISLFYRLYFCYRLHNLGRVQAFGKKYSIWIDSGCTIPILDWIQGLQFAQHESNSDASVHRASFYCIKELTELRQLEISPAEWQQVIHNLISTPQTGNFSPLILYYTANIEDITLEPLQEETLFKFLAQSPNQIEETHERYIRLMNHYITTSRPRGGMVKGDTSIPMTTWLFSFDRVPLDISQQYNQLLQALFTCSDLYSNFTAGSRLSDINYPCLVTIACRAQDLEGQLRFMEFMKSLLQKHFRPKPSDLNETHYYPLSLYILMACYVGEMCKRIEGFWSPWDSHIEPSHVFKPEVRSAVADLVGLLGQCRREIGLGRLDKFARDLPWRSRFRYTGYWFLVDNHYERE